VGVVGSGVGSTAVGVSDMAMAAELIKPDASAPLKPLQSFELNFIFDPVLTFLSLLFEGLYGPLSKSVSLPSF
jgi:hypothetical protein